MMKQLVSFLYHTNCSIVVFFISLSLHSLKICFIIHFHLETITDIIGVVGFPVELPCDVQPAVEGDQLLLILWYKEGYSSPIYT